MVIAQPVEDQLELSSGRSHRTDIAVAAAMSHLFSDRADATGGPPSQPFGKAEHGTALGNPRDCVSEAPASNYSAP
jgi:hypothetical protein